MIWLIWAGATFFAYVGFIKWSRYRQLSQQIYDDSPDRHQAKIGTPTMGGLILFLSFITGVFMVSQWTLPVIWIIATTALFWLIGLLDDTLSLAKNNNKGLSARSKFFCQIAVSLVAVTVMYQWVMPIKLWQAAIYIFLLTGSSNATNLTDGLDGLLSSTMLISLLGVFLLFQSQWMYEEQTLVLIMMAAIAIFLLFNWYPAKLFMGDVGSLMLGAFLASTVIVSGNWIMLIGFGAIYVIETLSVIIQVSWFKRTKKRFFLMSPLHHHFELLGVNEINVVILFTAFQGVFTWIQLQ